MKDRTIKKEVPVMIDGKMSTVSATFYPKRRSASFFEALKNFLNEVEGAHDCPHYLYIDAANHWVDTGTPFKSHDHEKQLVEWEKYLSSRALL